MLGISKTFNVNTFWVKIYLAGDIDVAKQVCREECTKEGLCVTVEPCEYIYTAGQETGFVIGLINYPRFPSEPSKILDRAKGLAEILMLRCCQNSALLMDPNTTTWITRRPENLKEKEVSIGK